jgi:hypothetical protein
MIPKYGKNTTPFNDPVYIIHGEFYLCHFATKWRVFREPVPCSTFAAALGLVKSKVDMAPPKPVTLF